MRQLFFFLTLCILWQAGHAAADPLAAVTLDDLRAEAVKAPPRLAALLRLAAMPADEVILKDGGKALIKLVPTQISAKADGDELELFDAGNEKKPLARDQVKEMRYFEERVLEQLGTFFEDDGGQTPAQRVQAAERVLRAVLAVHQGARVGPLSGPNPWGALRQRLLQRLEEVRGQILDSFVAGVENDDSWRQSSALAGAWLPLHPRGGLLRGKALTLWLRRAHARVKADDHAGAQSLLVRLDADFGQPDQADSLRGQLRKKAESLWEVGRRLRTDNPVQAADKMRSALTLWPGLPKGVEEWLQLEPKVVPIRVAVRSLPEQLSPALAWTDTERRCLDLVFEALVGCRRLETLGFRYHAQLAADLPRWDTDRLLVDMQPGRSFSSGEPITRADVRHTQELPGMRPPFADELGPDVVGVAGTALQAEFRPRQGLWDPLAALRFPILPEKIHGKPLSRADDPELARQPVGSGPYQFHGEIKDGGGRTWTVFLPNLYHPVWATRSRKDCPPIWLQSWKDAKDLVAPQLVLDATDQQLADLAKVGYQDVRTWWAPRVFMVAVNQRRGVLADASLRRALALALNRELVLDRHFRGGTKHHRPVNGPFPPESWAACPSPRVPAHLFDAEKARSLAKKTAKSGPIQLRLAFSTEDARQAGACQEMAKQWNELFSSAGADFRVDLTPLAPAAFQKALREREFDLALHHLDYSGPTFWLGALFDDREEALAAGGSNYLGHANDAKLQSLLRSILAHRQFSHLRELHHDLHAHLNDRMPLIPLWQLQVHAAVHPSLQLGEMDPAAPFANLREWKVK